MVVLFVPCFSPIKTGGLNSFCGHIRSAHDKDGVAPFEQLIDVAVMLSPDWTARAYKHKEDQVVQSSGTVSRGTPELCSAEGSAQLLGLDRASPNLLGLSSSQR